jgi:hypothetical protein
LSDNLSLKGFCLNETSVKIFTKATAKFSASCVFEIAQILLRRIVKMSQLHISDLNVAGSDLLTDAESFLSELQDTDTSYIVGGGGRKRRSYRGGGGFGGGPVGGPVGGGIFYAGGGGGGTKKSKGGGGSNIFYAPGYGGLGGGGGVFYAGGGGGGKKSKGGGGSTIFYAPGYGGYGGCGIPLALGD